MMTRVSAEVLTRCVPTKLKTFYIQALDSLGNGNGNFVLL
jgi:hypothetical protein